MLVYGGIDEAGYGPLLGPLCIGATVFVLEGDDPAAGAPNLWRRLESCVCRAGSDKKRRIAVEDSKKLKGANDAKAHPLRHLERGVLAFALASGQASVPGATLAADGPSGDGPSPSFDDERLLRALGVQLPTSAAAPWYAGATPLPLAHEAAQVGIAAATLRRGLERAGVRCARLACTCVDVGDFNTRLARAGSKATVNFDAIVQLLDSIWRAWPEAHPRIVVDRQGGRMLYREPLSLCFPDASIAVLGETERVSRYRLERDGSLLTVSFEAESEGEHLPTALASMIAKYSRELLMRRLNAWFGQHAGAVRPTAGYVQDGRRWLAEMESVIERLGLDREALVRRA
jgi:hypothetical protein